MQKKAVDAELSSKAAAISNIAASAIAAPKQKRHAPATKTKAVTDGDSQPQNTLVKKVRVKKVVSVPAEPKTTHQASKLLAERPKLAPVVQSPYRFPINIDHVMAKVARVGGVAFVILGALCTLTYVSAFFSATTQSLSSDPESKNVAALVSATDATVTNNATSTDGNVQVEFAATELKSYILVNALAPLRGVVEVAVVTPQANKVELFMYTESWQNKRSIGFATQIAAGRWTYAWDTTKVASDQKYRLTAHVWGKTRYAADSDPDYVLQHDYMYVNNSVATTSTNETVEPEGPIDEKPVVELRAPTTLTGVSSVTVAVAGASAVSLIVEHADTGSRNYLYNAIKLSPDEWRVNWSTANYKDGEYLVKARIQNKYGSYVDGVVVVVLDNTPEATVETVNDTVDESLGDTEMPQKAIVPLALPVLKLRTSEKAIIDGTERIEADISVDVASHVYFYLRDPLSAVPRFVGAGIKTTGSTRWYTNWYTNNTPNGTYTLFARAITPPGPIDSQFVTVTVANHAGAEKTAAAVLETERITTQIGSLANDAQTLKSPTASLSPKEVSTEPAPATSEVSGSAVPVVDTASLLRTHREAIDAELIRLGTAYRLKDEPAVSRIKTRIAKLVEQMVATAPADARTDLRAKLENAIADIIAKYTAEVDRVGQLIEERKQNDVLKDTDKDSVSDFDEVTLYNTNPLAADSDNDGFTDGAEILSGFDPLSDVRESVIVYESPKETGIFREDLLVIENVAAAELPQATTSAPTKSGILLAGRGLPNSFATLYIFSTPVIVTVKTDAEGAFEYRFDQELEDGQHSVYVGITDNAGRIVAKSQPFSFIKEAQAITPNQAAVVDNSAAAEADNSLITGYAFAAIVSISVVAIGLVLILLGLQLEARRRKTPLEEAVVTPTI